MPEVSFSGLLIVTIIAFLVPLSLGLIGSTRLPGVVVEILAGIAVGPSVLGWVEVDLPLEVLSVLGLAFLLFLGGLEVDLTRLRGPFLRIIAAGLAVSLALALAAGLALPFDGSPLFVAILLSATSLGMVIPVLKDAGESASPFGQLGIAAASVADFAAVILLSLFFARDDATAILLLSFVVVSAAIGISLALAGRSMRVSAVLLRMQDTTAEIPVRGAVVLLMVFVWMAEVFGLETILAAFAAGAVLRLLDRDEMMTHPHLRSKLEGLAFGFFVPVFFVTSGIRFDLDALLGGGGTLVLVPLLLLALLFVRGVPAALYLRLLDRRRTLAAALLQATSLPFIVAGAEIGMQLGAIDAGTGAALIAAGLLSVVFFPAAALTVLRGAPPMTIDGGPAAEARDRPAVADTPTSRG